VKQIPNKPNGECSINARDEKEENLEKEKKPKKKKKEQKTLSVKSIVRKDAKHKVRTAGKLRTETHGQPQNHQKPAPS